MSISSLVNHYSSGVGSVAGAVVAASLLKFSGRVGVVAGKEASLFAGMVGVSILAANAALHKELFSTTWANPKTGGLVALVAGVLAHFVINCPRVGGSLAPRVSAVLTAGALGGYYLGSRISTQIRSS
jgi:hypothetical protein